MDLGSTWADRPYRPDKPKTINLPLHFPHPYYGFSLKYCLGLGRIKKGKCKMATLEQLTRDSVIKGILPNQSVTVIEAKWHGSDIVELTYKDTNGQPHTELILRDRESTLEISTLGNPWSFDGNGELFRLVSEAHRIHLAYLFDPLLAVHTSLVEPLPHQITAVIDSLYGSSSLMTQGQEKQSWQDF